MAAITFSGFNNIDFNQVVTAIMAQERQPLRTLETQQSTLKTQNGAFGTLASRLSNLQSAITVLGGSTAVAGGTATSSDASVGASTSGQTVEGTYEVVVSSLARRQVTASASSYASTDEVVATGGALTLTGADGTSAVITVDALMTVKELVDAINSAQDAPVAASLVQSTPGSYQIVLTGRSSGATNAFTVQSALAGGSGLTFIDTDGNGVSGDSAADNVQTATNANLTINGLAIVSASNTISDAVPGATLTLAGADPNKTVTVTVARDASAAKERVEKLVTAYNDLTTFINEQRTAAGNGQASIARDPLVQQLRNALRGALLGEYQNGGTHTRLAEVGIGFDQTGKIVLDETRFEAAMANPTNVRLLFSGDSGTEGAFGALGALIKGYTQSGGLVADVRQRLSTQMRSLTNRMDAIEPQLERRRLTLQREFQAADEAMSILNAQMASLASLGGQFRLF
jgi:flagellar hook-associated protein 2